MPNTSRKSGSFWRSWIALDDMALPSLRLHPLKGELAGFWSVTIRANWRIVFRFDGRNAADVDLIDYH
jgi:proteic killer suppression protein